MEKRYRFMLIGFAMVISAIYLVYDVHPNAVIYTIYRRTTKLTAVWLCSYLATSSTVYFQIISQNQILTPAILGFEKMYLLIQVIVVFTTHSLLQTQVNFLVSVSIMIVVASSFYGYILKKVNEDIHVLLLLGVILGTLLSSITSTLKLMMDANEFSIVQSQSYASFNAINSDVLVMAMIMVVPGIVLIRSYKREFDVYSLGYHHASNLGINIERFQTKSLLVVSSFSAISTALVGPIGFLGLLSSHIARLCVKTHTTKNLVRFGTLLIGIVLLVSQMVFEQVLHFNTSVSVVLNIIGGLLFILMLIKENQYDKNM